jgi:hypothetical protein
MQHSLSPADRKFIVEQLEPITRMPVSTAAEEDAWYAATRATMERLDARFLMSPLSCRISYITTSTTQTFIGRSHHSEPLGKSSFSISFKSYAHP